MKRERRDYGGNKAINSKGAQSGNIERRSWLTVRATTAFPSRTLDSTDMVYQSWFNLYKNHQGEGCYAVGMSYLWICS